MPNNMRFARAMELKDCRYLSPPDIQKEVARVKIQTDDITRRRIGKAKWRRILEDQRKPCQSWTVERMDTVRRQGRFKGRGYGPGVVEALQQQLCTCQPQAIYAGMQEGRQEDSEQAEAGIEIQERKSVRRWLSEETST